MTTRRQDLHSVPTLGLRFGDELAWITDTAYDPGSASFARGCRLLAHEAWWASTAPRNPDIHSSAAQAASVAQQAEVERLLLIHLPPFELALCHLLEEARAEVPEAMLAADEQNVSALLTTAGLVSSDRWPRVPLAPSPLRPGLGYTAASASSVSPGRSAPDRSGSPVIASAVPIPSRVQLTGSSRKSA